jgi:TolB-like protein/Flp pilus assembly protein TadD
VLPFVNMSADPEQEYFCDGMAEELISTLSRIEGLAVVARTSTFQLKGQALDVREIGERLGVRTVVSGSVRKAGNRLRITAQLSDAGHGFQLWSDSYERTLDDVFAIQDEIAKAISESLRVRLSSSSGAPLIGRGTDNLDAYNLYLRGRFNMNRLSVDIRAALFAARDAFDQAIALDPRFAAAYAGLSMCYNALGYQTIMPASEAGHKAFEAAQRAIALDATSPEAHTALGFAKTVFSIDLATAEQSFRRAMELGPSCAAAYAWYSVLLTALGRFEEAEGRIARARELDPLLVTLAFNTALNQVCAKRYQEAILGMRELITLEPTFAGAYWFLGLALGGQKLFDEAVAALERGAEITRRAPLFVGLLGLLHAHAGRREEAEEVLAELGRSPECPQYVFALIYGALGDRTRGMDLLEAAVERHDDMVFLAKVDWRFDCLRDDPRFPRLLERMGLVTPG